MELLTIIFVCIGSFSLGVYVVEKITGEDVSPLFFSIGLLFCIILNIFIYLT